MHGPYQTFLGGGGGGGGVAGGGGEWVGKGSSSTESTS